jgi:hypothetical protein
MFLDVMDELQFFPVIFNFDMCFFEIYGTLVAQINHMCAHSVSLTHPHTHINSYLSIYVKNLLYRK